MKQQIKAIRDLLAQRRGPSHRQTTDACTSPMQRAVAKPAPIKAKIDVSAIGVSAPVIDEPQLQITDSPSNDGMPGEILQRTEPDAVGSLVVLPNGRTARVERVEQTSRVIDGTVSPGGNTITRTRVVPSASIFRGMTRASSALSPESQVGATVMLPNGRMGVVKRVEVRRYNKNYYPQAGEATVRPVHVTQAVQMLSPESQPGAVVVLPNGKTATVTRVETRTLPQVTANSATPRVGEVVVLPNGRTATVTGVQASRKPETPPTPAVTKVEAALRNASKALGTPKRSRVPTSVANVRDNKLDAILGRYNMPTRSRVPTMPIRSNHMPTSPCSPRF